MEPGDRIVYEIEDGSVRVRSAKSAIDALCGVFARPGLPPQDLDAVRAQFQEDVARRVVAR